jgi:hypothetical protein
MTIRTSGITSEDDTESEVHIEPDLYFPKFVELDVTDEPDMDVDAKIALTFSTSQGRYVADSITVKRRAGGDVNAITLRAVRVQDLIQRGTRNLPVYESTRGRVALSAALTAEQVDAIHRLGPSQDEALRWAARVYLIAAALNMAPAKAVADQLGLTTPNASVWIRRARDRGLLSEPPRDVPPTAEFETARKVLSD